MDIAADDPVIGLILDHLRPVTSLKEMPHTAVTQSVPSSIGREKLLHTQCEVGARGLDQQVQMVTHEYEGRQFPLTPGKTLALLEARARIYSRAYKDGLVELEAEAPESVVRKVKDWLVG